MIDTPAASLTWAVGDTVGFSGHATDAQDGTLPASAVSWSVILHHCTSGCHTHLVQTFGGVAWGSFAAPDHDYPSYLELQLTAGATTAKAPFTVTVIQNGAVQLTAPTPQTVRGKRFAFVSWSDGGARVHTITAPSTPRTYTATYRRVR